MSGEGGLHAELCTHVANRTTSVRLTAAPGEVIAVVGPNGAGKTTLLRALAGLLPIDTGRVQLDGRLLEDPSLSIRVAPEHRSTGVVFQDHLLFEHLSVLDNVAFSLRAAGTSRTQARAAAAQLLERLDLGAFASRRPRGLSGGESQQVAIARALASRPSMLLLDEPLASLDPATGDARRSDLRSYLALMDGPTLLVTHDIIDAATLATRLLVLEEGRVTSDGPVGEVLRRPTTDYLARFAGVSLLRGVAEDGVLVTHDGGRVRIADRRRRGTSLAVLRPDSLRLHPLEGTPGEGCWSGTIDSLEQRGATVIARVVGRPSVDVELSLAAYAALDPVPGDPVCVEVLGDGLEVYADPSEP